jgi:hypothetical protein
MVLTLKSFYLIFISSYQVVHRISYLYNLIYQVRVIYTITLIKFTFCDITKKIKTHHYYSIKFNI